MIDSNIPDSDSCTGALLHPWGSCAGRCCRCCWSSSGLGEGGGGGTSCPLADRIWSMSCCRGSWPDLRTQTYLQCICRAACAVRLSPQRPAHSFLPKGGREGGRMGAGAGIEIVFCGGDQKERRRRRGTEWEPKDPGRCQVAELHGKHEPPPG